MNICTACTSSSEQQERRATGAGHPWLFPLGIFLLALVFYLYGNGAISLWDRDEPRFAQASREMLEAGNHLVPSLQGVPRFDKPILTYWLMELAYAVFGVNEFAARFFQALLGAASCALTVLFGTALFSPRVGILAGLLLATSPQMVVVSKAATADAPFLFFILLALYAFVQIYMGSRRLEWFCLLYGGLALATLTKGPAGAALITCTILGFLLISREMRVLRDLRVPGGLLLFFLIVGPWFLAANLATGWGFFTRGILYHTVERALRPFEGHAGPFFYYPFALLIGFFPWSPFLPQALRVLFPLERRSRFLLAWAGVTIGLFTLARTKLPHYILPMYPAACLIVAALLVPALAEGKELLQLRWGKITVWLLGLLPAILLPLLLFATRKVGFEQEAAGMAIIGILLVVMGAGSALLLVRHRDALAVALLGGGMTCFLLLVIGVLLPNLDRYKISKPLAVVVLAMAGPNDLIAGLDVGEPSLVFYLKGRLVALRGEQGLREALAGPRRVWVILPCERLSALPRNGHLPLILVAQRKGFNFANGTWVHLCIASNSPPTGGANLGGGRGRTPGSEGVL